MKKLAIGMAISAALVSFASKALAEEIVVNGRSEIYITAQSQSGLFSKCRLLKAHLYRGFKAVGQDKMDMDMRVFDIKKIRTQDQKIVKKSGLCTITWEESNINAYHDRQSTYERGERKVTIYPLLVK